MVNAQKGPANIEASDSCYSWPFPRFQLLQLGPFSAIQPLQLLQLGEFWAFEQFAIHVCRAGAS
jgi:hypothetical protein